MKQGNVKLLVCITLLIFTRFSQLAYCEENWRFSRGVYYYNRSIIVKTNEFNEQRNLHLDYQEENDIILNITGYSSFNSTVTYLSTVYSSSFQTFRTSQTINDERILVSNVTRTTELFDEFNPNFVLGLEYATKVLDEINKENGNTFITKFNLTVSPQFFIEKIWYQYEIQLEEWATLFSTIWSSDNFYNGYIFAIETKYNEFTIQIKFPYVQSVYTGYASNVLSNLFGALSRYAEARGEYIQQIHFLYSIETGRLFTFSNIIQIVLPGKASIKYEENIHDRSYIKAKKSNTLKILLPILGLSIVAFVGFKYRKKLQDYLVKRWRRQK
ncbi:MAG: hypothetical protein ACTSYD_13355 [Candidatus Heimdallarchaeaceae archaeon]